jgi:hypothetical protein
MPSNVGSFWIRVPLGLLGVAGFGYAAWLGTDKNISGVTVAAAFAVAMLLLIVAIAGQVPASLKVGDVSLQMYAAAKAEGVQQGAKLAAEAAKGEDVDKVSDMAASAFPQSELETAGVKTALTTVRNEAQAVKAATEANGPQALTAVREGDLFRAF